MSRIDDRSILADHFYLEITMRRVTHSPIHPKVLIYPRGDFVRVSLIELVVVLVRAVIKDPASGRRPRTAPIVLKKVDGP